MKTNNQYVYCLPTWYYCSITCLFLLNSCARLSPRLQVNGNCENLYISWENTEDYNSVDVLITDPEKTVHKINASKSKGPASAQFKGNVAGEYKVELITIGSKTNTREQPLAVAICKVPEPLFDFVSLDDLKRSIQGKEKLDILFLIHPEIEFGGKTGSKEATRNKFLFREMTANVLREVFQSAVELREENDLISIEDQRNKSFKDLKAAKWPLNPDALVIVDLRKPDGLNLPGQLYVRILDLKLIRSFDQNYYGRKKDNLYHRRALVMEGYHEINSFSGFRVIDEMREGWQNVLNEILEDPQYKNYKQAIEKINNKKNNEETFNKNEILLLKMQFFGEVDKELVSVRSPSGAASTEKQLVDEIQDLLLFGEIPLTPDKAASPPEPDRTTVAGSTGLATEKTTGEKSENTAIIIPLESIKSGTPGQSPDGSEIKPKVDQ